MKYQCLACKAADNCELSWKDPTEEYMNCTEFKAPPRTNADRIRSMTDDELAKFLCFMNHECYECPGDEMCSCGENGMLKWLKEEAGET